MAKFPVELGDEEGIIEAINYTLSGPAGLGQNFQGTSSNVVQGTNTAAPFNQTAFLTGNFRTPFVSAAPAATYVNSINLASAEFIDSRTIQFNFAETQAEPPFALGNNIQVDGVVSATYDYNGKYTGTGVVVCTTEYVVVRIVGDNRTYANGYGGQAEYNAFGGFAFVSTDMGAKVTVNSATDRVFISAQLNNVLSYTSTETSSVTYTVMINRRKAFPTNDPTNPDYVFGDTETITAKNYYMQTEAGSGTLPAANPGTYQVGVQPLETIFTSIIDLPDLGYYWYLLDIEVDVTGGDAVITQSQLTNRSISVQVVKQ